MTDLSATLGKQAGPLPVGAWIVVVGGGLGIAWWARKNSSSTPATVDTSGTVDSSVGTGPGGWTQVLPTAATATPNVGVPTTNDQWAALALTWASTNTNYSLSDVTNAISKYLAGEQRTVAEETILNSIFRQVGAPPFPGPAATLPVTPVTPTTPGTLPPPASNYVGPAKKKSWKTDNIAFPKVANWEAVLLYYYDNVAPPGTSRALQMWKLIAANGGKSFKSGMRVTLPNQL